jgi:preprotein translocase subunit SecF
MELFRKATNIDFLGQRRIAAVFSAVLIAASLLSLAIRGLNFGIDFTGGTLVEVGYVEPVELETVRSALRGSEFRDAIVQAYGTVREVLIRLPPEEERASAEISDRIVEILRAAGHDMEVRRVDFVGPQVGKELAIDGGLAMLYAIIGILIYVTLRFEWRLSLGAILALLHDPILIFGFFSFTQMTFDLTVLAAVLAVIGYSINDTIVVFDRARENFRRMRVGAPVEIFNASVNQTLSRTIMTSVATLLVVVAMFFLGGEVLRGFSTALIIGIVIGTYSSIYIASAAALALGLTKKDLMPVPKEGAELDRRP